MKVTKLKKIQLPPEAIKSIEDCGGTDIKAYELDECKVIVSRDNGRWHLSISHPYRYPLHEEINLALNTLFPIIKMELNAISNSQYCIHFLESKSHNKIAN